MTVSWPLQIEQRYEEPSRLSTRLRISLTSKCNLACFFCHNEGQTPQASSRLGVDEYVQIVRVALDEGVTRIKLTGGEPLLYRDGVRDVRHLVEALGRLKSSFGFEFSMTTNGTLLNRYVSALRDAGLDRVTVSIHTRSEARHRTLIAKVPSAPFVDPVLAVEAAVDAGLKETKINSVLFGDGVESNVGDIASIHRRVSELGVVEHRLYTVIDPLPSAEVSALARYWDRGLAESVGRQLVDEADLQDFVSRVLEFAHRRPYPGRESLVIRAGGSPIVIDAMEPGRFESLGVSDEGPYSLRLGADGSLRAFLDSRGQPVLAELADGPVVRNVGELATQFRAARRSIQNWAVQPAHTAK